MAVRGMWGSAARDGYNSLMEVTREDVTPCLVTFDIQVEPERYAEAVTKAKKDLGRRTEVPGFRRGKAPMAVLDRVLDPERVQELAGEYVMPDAVREVLKEHELDPWDSPSVEVLEAGGDEGFKFKATVPLSPQVELGQYVGLSVERAVRPVTDEVIDREIERLRQQHTRLEPKEEGEVGDEDYVFVSIQELDENGEPKGEPAFNTAVIGENVPDFDSNVKGMKKDETRDFTINYPEDWGEAERAGQSVQVRVSVTHIYSQVKPEVDDEFAKTAGGVDTVDALKEEIRSAAQRAFTQLADEQVDNDIVRQIVQGSKVDYPPQMLTHEFGHRVQDLFQDLQRRNMSFEQYLEQISQTEEQFRSAMEARIDQDLRVGLVLGEIAAKEEMQVSEEEIAQELDQIVQQSGSDEIREQAQTPQARSSVARRLMLRKSLEFLRGASNIIDVSGSQAAQAAENKEA